MMPSTRRAAKCDMGEGPAPASRPALGSGGLCPAALAGRGNDDFRQFRIRRAGQADECHIRRRDRRSARAGFRRRGDAAPDRLADQPRPRVPAAGASRPEAKRREIVFRRDRWPFAVSRSWQGRPKSGGRFGVGSGRPKLVMLAAAMLEMSCFGRCQTFVIPDSIRNPFFQRCANGPRIKSGVTRQGRTTSGRHRSLKPDRPQRERAADRSAALCLYAVPISDQKTRAYCSLPTKPSLPTPLRLTTAITRSTTI